MSSRELFGSDRSAIRLGLLLRELGYEASLFVPQQRPERGLTALAEASGLRVYEMPIALATSRGVSGIRGLAEAPSQADLTIYNSSSILNPSPKGTKRILILREWISPTRLAHVGLMTVHRQRIDAAVGVSKAVLSQADRMLPKNVVRAVIPNWLDVTTPRPRSPDANGVLCVGRFNQWKGQEVLADAWEQAFASAPNPPRLTFVGAEAPPSPFAGAAQRLRRRAEGSPWSVLPFSPNVDEHYLSHGVLVVPSLRPEPFGNVLIEALRCQCPVLAFQGAGPDDVADVAPEMVTTVPRARGALAQALATWHRNPPAPLPLKAIEVRLLEHYSRSAAQRAWQALLQDLGRDRRDVRRRRPLTTDRSADTT